MALSKLTSRALSDQPSRLYATHNPTQTAPSFLLPIFTRPPHGNALYTQRVSLNTEVILSFETISETLKLDIYEAALTARVNDPVIHAFETSNSSVIVGTQSELSPKLASLVDDTSLLNLPSLRLEVIEFCSLNHLIADAAGNVYRFLQSVSPYSASYWRDQTFLASRVRKNLQKHIDSREGKLESRRQLDGVTLAIKNDRPILTCSSKVYNSFKQYIDWEAWAEGIKDVMQFHIGAFARTSQLQFVVESDSTQKEASSVSSPRSRVSGGRWLVAAFGQTATVAARYVHKQGITAAHLDTSNGRSKEVNAAIMAAQRRSKKEGQETPFLLVLMSSTEDSALEAVRFVESLPRDVRVQGILLYRTQDGVPSDELSGELLRSGRFERITIIPDNDFPIGESHTKTSRGTLVASLIGVLDRLMRDGRKLPRGRSIYSMAWTRFGLRGYEEALARSIAAAANPWVPVTRARRAVVSLSSVGRPDSRFSEDIGRQLNDTLFYANQSSGQDASELVVEAKWIQRRFMPGGVIPATVELLLTDVSEGRGSPEKALGEAAKTILSAVGYNVRKERNGSFTISSNGAEPLLITVRDVSHSIARDVCVQLMPDKKIQQSALRQHDGWKIALPLLVGDLYFLSNVQDPRWTATLLAHLAQPKRLWPAVLKEFVEQSLQRELRRSDSYRNLWMKNLPKSAVITATSVDIRNTERLAGRQATISGAMTVEFSLPTVRKGLRSEGSSNAKFSVKMGPDEFSVTEFELSP